MAQIFLEQASNTFINWTKNFQASVEWRYKTNNIFAENDKLHVTAWFGLRTSAQKLLTNTDTDINTMSGYFGTALQTAAARGHKDTAELLLQLLGSQLAWSTICLVGDVMTSLWTGSVC
ncbi:hypothetical protein F5878DRAFT_668154 [Lentinula raphanica]|uniref:Ankyrin n=1 Tax=Lentinula raphanica TaxID=153919 RepID=A0AA38NUM2_9AGAR|nr:hypothetical protein F5878DRAFT_668154 [Lentinula raphanica]